MMNDAGIYQIKYLIPAGGEVDIESDYRVVPLGKSLVIADFTEAIKSDM